MTPILLPTRTSPPRLALALVLLMTLAVAPDLRAATLEITGPAGTAIFLDGSALGFLPLGDPVTAAAGTHLLRCEMPGFVTYSQELRLAAAEDHLRVIVRLTPLSKRTAVASNLLLAGLGQHYLGHRWRGFLYNTAEIGGLLTALGGAIQRSTYRQDYLVLQGRYNQAINADEIATLRAAADKAYADMEDMESLRNLGLAVAGGAVILSMLDAWLSFPAIHAGAGPYPVTAATPVSDIPVPAAHAGVSLTF